MYLAVRSYMNVSTFDLRITRGNIHTANNNKLNQVNLTKYSMISGHNSTV